MSSHVAVQETPQQKAERLLAAGTGRYGIINAPVGYGPPPYYAVKKLAGSEQVIAFVEARDSGDLVPLVEACEMLRTRQLEPDEARALLSS